MKISLVLRLRKEAHKEIALAQDLIVETLYAVFSDAVLHGGTAIWRCYQGNRFSEDVDSYINRDPEKLTNFFKILEQKGFVIEKKKISQISIFSKLRFNRVPVRFEVLFKSVKGSLKEYETAEGNFLTVLTLTPEEFIHEKVAAYLKRLKIRDLFDIFFLLRYVDNISKVKPALEQLLTRFKQPLDEKDLKALILEGIVPDTEKMLDYIGRKVQYGKGKI